MLSSSDSRDGSNYDEVAGLDGTLARDGIVSEEALEALRALRKSGRRPILATGRIADQLAGIFPHLDLFDAVVAENGAVLFDPSTGRLEALAEPPPSAFGSGWWRRACRCSKSDASSSRRGSRTRRQSWRRIRELGLGIGLTFNKGAVSDSNRSPEETRRRVADAVRKRYTSPA